MKQMNQVFYIHKSSYIKGDVPEADFIPPMVRRRLKPFAKAALFVMNNVFENPEADLVFASNYGDLDRVRGLIEQKNVEGEISPTGFSMSVHNSTVGLFSLLNKVNSSYNSVSAGEYSLDAGLLESVIADKDVVFCFAENEGGLRALALNVGQAPKEGSIAVEFISGDFAGDEVDGFEKFVEFLNSADVYEGKFFRLKKVS